MSSDYINNERREFSLYVLQSRAIPHAADGLKAAARRVLWTAKSMGKVKAATLAGATMPIHPHAQPESTINTLAADYGNNVKLLSSKGAFGTLLRPTSYGAVRYTTVWISQFTKDVMFRDVEIIPMVENYDSTTMEPKHFLPLVPISLLNPQEGIAVGFACSILPRMLEDLIGSQIEYLTKGKVTDVYPGLMPTNSYCDDWVEDKNGNIKWVFTGEFEKVNATTVRITNLPYGITHAKYRAKLDKLEESGDIQEVVDDSTRVYNIEVRFKKGFLRGKSDDDILDILGLKIAVAENLNLVDFDGKRVTNTDYVEHVSQFTEWRLGWYVQRYERLASLIEIDIQKYKEGVIKIIITDNGCGIAENALTKTDSESDHQSMGIGIVKDRVDLLNSNALTLSASFSIYNIKTIDPTKTGTRAEIIVPVDFGQVNIEPL